MIFIDELSNCSAEKVKTVVFGTLSWPPSLLTCFVAFTVLWTYPLQMKSLR